MPVGGGAAPAAVAATGGAAPAEEKKGKKRIFHFCFYLKIQLFNDVMQFTIFRLSRCDANIITEYNN